MPNSIRIDFSICFESEENLDKIFELSKKIDNVYKIRTITRYQNTSYTITSWMDYTRFVEENDMMTWIVSDILSPFNLNIDECDYIPAE